MSNLINFDFNDHPIRVVMIDDEPWFVAADVCRELDITNVIQTVKGQERRNRYGEAYWSGGLPTSEWGLHTVYTPSGEQNMLCVNEPGLYRLVFKSRTNEAESFKTWVVREVLPSIRKHGMYAKDEILDNPDLLIEVATRLRDERNARLAAEAKVQELEPKGEFFDAVADSKDCHSVGDAAKLIGTGQNRLFAWLRGEKILLSSNRPYQRYIDEGYFRVIERTWTDEKGDPHLYIKPMVTGKGLTWLQKRYGKGA